MKRGRTVAGFRPSNPPSRNTRGADKRQCALVDKRTTEKTVEVDAEVEVEEDTEEAAARTAAPDIADDDTVTANRPEVRYGSRTAVLHGP